LNVMAPAGEAIPCGSTAATARTLCRWSRSSRAVRRNPKRGPGRAAVPRTSRGAPRKDRDRPRSRAAQPVCRGLRGARFLVQLLRIPVQHVPPPHPLLGRKLGKVHVFLPARAASRASATQASALDDHLVHISTHRPTKLSPSPNGRYGPLLRADSPTSRRQRYYQASSCRSSRNVATSTREVRLGPRLKASTALRSSGMAGLLVSRR